MNRFNKHLMASSNGLLIKLGGSDVRNIVVAVLLKMYQPELFFGGASRSGLNISIAKALNCERDTVSKSISKAVFNYKTYIDFRNEVDFVYNILIKRDLQNGYRTN